MTFEEVVHYRRSVRHYKDTPIDTDKVRACLELATMAPNSSNMQLWEFYHVTHPDVLRKMAVACLGQMAATTASQMVVFVTRQDLHRSRAKMILELETQNILKNSPPEKHSQRIRQRQMYYGKLMPFLYSSFLGIPGTIRKLAVTVGGVFRPVPHEVSENDMRVVVHKTCALAAQTFMLAMANEGYDTCPMEGFDSRRVRKILDLPAGAEINMVVSCGFREKGGIWGDRMRLPFSQVYHRID